MIYYKNMVVSVILSVVLLLIFIGVIMYNSKNNQIYPAVFSPCPDYYSLDSLGKCNANTSIWGFSAGNKCLSNNFSDKSYKTPGVGKGSGLCSMKQWASDCGVTWDGVTNNSSICYN